MAFALLCALLLLLCLYLRFPDKIYVFDGVMFSYIIERHVVNVQTAIFNRRHLFFIPFMMMLRDGLRAIGYSTDAYPLIQKTNSCFGALGIWIYYRLIRRLTKDAALSILLAAGLGLSCAYWSRATEGQVYMLMTCFALATLAAACALSEEPRWRNRLILIAAYASAASFHIINIVLAPVAATALWLSAPPERRLRSLWLIAAMLALTAIPFLWAFHIRGPSSLLAFLMTATEAYSPAKTNGWADFIHRFFFPGGMKLAARAETVLNELPCSWLSCPVAGPWLPFLAASLWAGLGIALYATRRHWAGFQRSALLLLALTALGFVGFIFMETFWIGGTFFSAVPLAVFLGLASVPLSHWLKNASPGRRRISLGTLLLAILGTGAWNLWSTILPQSQLENNASYKQALFVRDHTAATSWTLISGPASVNLKTYLPYYARRSCQILEYYLDSAPKPQALARFREVIQFGVQHGVPIYVLSDLVEDAPPNPKC